MILLLFFAIFMYYIFLSAKKGEIKEEEIIEKESNLSVWLSVIYIAGGLGALVFGGDLIVGSATELAVGWGMSETVIGLTIVAMGTSLPELATSLVAAYKGNSDIAIGNVVGSNIFNIFWILGLTAVIQPIAFNLTANIDIFVNIGATVLLFLFLFSGEKQKMNRQQGATFIFLYAVYILYLINRG